MCKECCLFKDCWDNEVKPEGREIEREYHPEKPQNGPFLPPERSPSPKEGLLSVRAVCGFCGDVRGTVFLKSLWSDQAKIRASLLRFMRTPTSSLVRQRYSTGKVRVSSMS
jgi:hypothetical protein